MNSETKIYQIPEFTGEHIPVKEAARIMGKDYQFVRLGLIEGILPIGTAYKMNDSSALVYNLLRKVLGIEVSDCPQYETIKK